MVCAVSLKVTGLIPEALSENAFPSSKFICCNCTLVFKEMLKMEPQWGC